MSDLNPQPLPPRQVRVQVMGGVLNDLEKFQKVQASLLGHLGCPGCTSGLQVIWQNYENWAVNAAGAISPVPSGVMAGGAGEE
jgi:hypothetical protein